MPFLAFGRSDNTYFRIILFTGYPDDKKYEGIKHLAANTIQQSKSSKFTDFIFFVTCISTV